MGAKGTSCGAFRYIESESTCVSSLCQAKISLLHIADVVTTVGEDVDQSATACVFEHYPNTLACWLNRFSQLNQLRPLVPALPSTISSDANPAHEAESSGASSSRLPCFLAYPAQRFTINQANSKLSGELLAFCAEAPGGDQVGGVNLVKMLDGVQVADVRWIDKLLRRQVLALHDSRHSPILTIDLDVNTAVTATPDDLSSPACQMLDQLSDLILKEGGCMQFGLG